MDVSVRADDDNRLHFEVAGRSIDNHHTAQDKRPNKLDGVKGWESAKCSSAWKWFCKDVMGWVVEVKIQDKSFIVGKNSALQFIQRNNIPFADRSSKNLSPNLQNQAIKSVLEGFANPSAERAKKPAAAPLPRTTPSLIRPRSEQEEGIQANNTWMSQNDWKGRLKEFRDPLTQAPINVDENFLEANGFTIAFRAEGGAVPIWQIRDTDLGKLMVRYAPAKTAVDKNLQAAVSAGLSAAEAAIAGDAGNAAPAKPHAASSGSSDVSRAQQEELAKQAALRTAARAPASPGKQMVPASPAKAAPSPEKRMVVASNIPRPASAQDLRVGLLGAPGHEVVPEQGEQVNKLQFGTPDIDNPNAARLPRQWVNLFASVTYLKLNEEDIIKNGKETYFGRFKLTNMDGIVDAIIHNFDQQTYENKIKYLNLYRKNCHKMTPAVKSLLPLLESRMTLALNAPAARAIEAPPAAALSVSSPAARKDVAAAGQPAAESITLEEHCPTWLKDDGTYVNPKSDELDELERNLEAAFEKSPAVLNDELCFYVAKRIDSYARTGKGVNAGFDANLKKLPANTKAKLNTIANLFPKWKKAHQYFAELQKI